MHLALKKGTKHFHYTSNSQGIFTDSLFHKTKNPMVDMKIQVYSKFRFFLEKNEISKIHEEWKNSPSQV
jgi:hypothetical protein